MRFTELDSFDITDLKLDEGNYRFRGASDQRKCIEKIYFYSDKNFRAMMESLAEDDMGELLLVYKDKNRNNVVMDGNRRLAALMVLHNPLLAPSESLRKFAERIDTSKLQFNNLQAQVSEDKSLILRTVYERHSAGGGKSRINWPAFGRARFSYENEAEELPESEWRIIALLSALEQIDSTLSDYLDSRKYKHEVFRRIVPKAIELDLIPKKLFSYRNKNIKKSEKVALKSAHKVCCAIFKDIENEVIGLSRKPGSFYADAHNVRTYLERYVAPQGVSSDASSSPSTKSPATVTSDTDTSSAGQPSSGTSGDGSAPDSNSAPSSGIVDKGRASKGNNGITFNERISRAIEATSSEKFSQLYNSICRISITQHPSLVIVGTWMFYETLASALGKDDKTSVDSFFSSSMIDKNWPGCFVRKEKQKINKALEKIRDEANELKHSHDYRVESAKNLNPQIERLSKLTIKVLEKIKNEGFKESKR